jgi:hypothetical protein
VLGFLLAPARRSVHSVRMTVGVALLTMAIFFLIVILVVRIVPVVRHGRKVVLARPKPCSMHEAQHALDRLIGAGFDAEIVEDSDNGINMWANTKVGGEVKPDERYVIQVPRKQAKAANQV